MWPEGLIASFASDVEYSSINNVRPLGSLEIIAGRMHPLLWVSASRRLNRLSHQGTKALRMDFFVSLAP